jgi:thiamine-monophosphate kinase
MMFAALPLPEQLLIAKITRAAGRGAIRRSRKAITPSLVTGIGDDCAVLHIPPTADVLVTTDFSLENIHFRREWHRPQSVGHRCLARGLSDIAAMGGAPLSAFLSLALPAKLPQLWVDQFMDGLLKLARKHGVTLAGGDTSESPSGILADIMVLGTVPKGKAVLRSGARPADRIYVTGALGASAAALACLYSGKKINQAQFSRHFFPEPRVRVGQIARQEIRPSAMIDISDGLSTDLSHICEASGVGAEIWQAAIPRATSGKAGRPVALEFALHGGEDYELLFTAAPRISVPKRISGVPITCIGRIIRRKQILLIAEPGLARKLEARGWQHFAVTSLRGIKRQ